MPEKTKVYQRTPGRLHRCQPSIIDIWVYTFKSGRTAVVVSFASAFVVRWAKSAYYVKLWAWKFLETGADYYRLVYSGKGLPNPGSNLQTTALTIQSTTVYKRKYPVVHGFDRPE